MDADPEVQKREMGIRSARLLKVVPAYAAFVVLLIGGTVLLAGWVGDIRAFREIVQGWASMKVNTAIGLILSATAVFLASRDKSRADRSAAKILALVVLLLSAASLAADVAGIALPLENLISDPNPRAQPFPGRMSPGTALGFVLVGGAILSYGGLDRRPNWLFITFSRLVAILSGVALIGYAYGVTALYDVRLFVSMAVHTSLSFLLLGIGLITFRPWTGIVEFLTRDTLDGRMVRRVLPTAVLAPLFFGWIVLQGVNAEFYQPRFGFVLTGIVCSGLLLIVVSRTGGNLRDVEQARALIEQRLREHREWLWTTLHSIADGVLVTDRAGVVKLANPTAGELTGFPVEEMVGMHVDCCFRVFHGTSESPAVNPVDTVLATGEPAYLIDDAELQHREGDRVPIADACAPILDENLIVDGAVLVFRDISREREATRALHAAAEHKDQFIAMLGHELRNPLAAISNATALLEIAAREEDEYRQPLTVMTRQTRHMEKILNDLLDVSRLEYGKFNLECEHLDLREVIRSSVDDFRDRAAGKGLTLNVACSNDPLLVFADPTRLSQVFDNLLRNSVSFTDRGGSIVVGCERRERAAHVTVRDTGIGLSPEVASTMYEPFHQAPQEIDRSRGGLGLGLSIVKSLIALHGGTIQATSPGPGQGTTMIVTLPLKEPSPQSQVGSSPTPVQPRQILLIEDDADAAKMLSCLLEMDGHTVIHAETGELGLALVEHKQPDVLLCDIGLPGTMNGFDVARALRNRGVEIPRIAITGYGQPEVRTKGKEAGFHEVLIKPIDLETLGALLCMHPSSEISKREKSGHTASDKHLPRHDGGTTG